MNKQVITKKRSKLKLQQESLERLDELCKYVVEYINNKGLRGRPPLQPISKLFSNYTNSSSFDKKVNIVDLAQQGSIKHRRALVNEIFQYLSSELKISEKNIDKILENYYIHYYGSIGDLVDVEPSVLFTNFLNKVLIRKDSNYQEKCAKLAQVCFQEIWGVGPLDEFLNFGVDEKGHKVEEIAASGPNQLNITISGQKLKLTELNYSPDRLERLCKRLCKPALKTLNKVNPVVETEFLDHSRINVTGGEFTSSPTFNIRRHYPGALTVEDQIKYRSTTREFEKFLDIYCMFHPRIIVCGGQSTGKSTKIREICARLPRNSTVVTAETAMELGLEKIKKLITVPVRLGILPDDLTIEKLFRFNADAIVIGEARGAGNVMAYKESCFRTDNITCTSWHADSPESVLPDMGANLMSGGYATSEDSAKDTLAKGTDLIIFMKNCDESYGVWQGTRHIERVVEVPDEISTLPVDSKYRDIFKYDYETMQLKSVQPISEEHQKKLLSRVHSDEALALMERLKVADYLR